VSLAADDRHYFTIRFPLDVEGRQWLGGIAIDVSERVRAERSLSERTAEFETLFHNAPVPLWIARDSQGREILGNAAADELIGLPRGANASMEAGAGWRLLHEARTIDVDALPMHVAMRERTLVPAVDLQLVRPDGSTRHVRMTAAPLLDAEGGVRGGVAAGLDISQLKAYESELERAVRRRDEFLAVLAHELRNPLAPIRNSVQILQRAPEDLQRVRRATATIDRQTSLLVRLIDDLLDVARISQGLVELDIAPRPVAAVVEGAVEAVRASAESTGHAIAVEHGSMGAMVQVDGLRAEQVLVNLLSNALKYSLPRTRVLVRSWIAEDEARIAVTDQGQGIAPEFLCEIFTMFARPGLDAKSRVSGMGVGLALAKQLCEQQGGRIEAASEGRGRGATFTVSFPLARAAENVAA
jgi:PAS domain S-box-containing protein